MMDDIDHIMRIMDASFDPAWGEAWNRRQVTDSLSMSHTHYRLVDSGGEAYVSGNVEASPAGFFLVRAAPGEEELLLVAVCPDQRGQGLGAALLELFASDAKNRGAQRIFLEMRENNPAISVYRRAGFEAIGRRPNYYRCASGGFIDAVTFARQL